MEEGATYDELVRYYLRIIAQCETQKWRLRAQLLALSVQCAVLELLAPERADEVQEQIELIEAEIRELDQMEEAARRALAQLRRDHGPIRHARGSAPEGGAERSHYIGAGQ